MSCNCGGKTPKTSKKVEYVRSGGNSGCDTELIPGSSRERALSGNLVLRRAPSKKKIDVVLLALRKAGIASDSTLTRPEPGAIKDALEDLEYIVAGYEADNIDLGYNFTENINPDDRTNLQLWMVEPLATQLAKTILLDNLRPVPPELSRLAFMGDELIRTNYVTVPSLVRRNDMPMGAGNDAWLNGYGEYYSEPCQTSIEDNNCMRDLVRAYDFTYESQNCPAVEQEVNDTLDKYAKQECEDVSNVIDKELEDLYNQKCQINRSALAQKILDLPANPAPHEGEE